jgi:hypothetical protein
MAAKPTVAEVLERARRRSGDGPSTEEIVAIIREMRGE